MSPAKRKEPDDAQSAGATEDLHPDETARLGKRQKTNDPIKIRVKRGRRLSRKERRKGERRKKLEEKLWLSGRWQQRRESRERRRTRTPSVTARHYSDNKELNALMSVLDFSKETEPLNCGEDTRNLHLEHIMSEDTHFANLVRALREFDERNIDVTAPEHPAHYKRKWCGWQTRELHKSGALDMVGCDPSSLTNPIHPIFHFNNFDRCPRAEYDQLVPALRLASQFLTHPACSRYWITLFKGYRRVDHHLSQKLGQKVWRYRSLVQYTPEAAWQTLSMLEQISPHVTFDFRPGLVLEDQECYAISRAENSKFKHSHQYLPREQTDPREELMKYMRACAVDDSFDPLTIHGRVHLSMDFYKYAKYVCKLSYTDEAVRLRFSLFLASVLAHEVAHLVEIRRQVFDFGRDYRAAGRPFDLQRFCSCVETFMYDWNEAEAGSGFEVTTFGARVLPINGRCDGATGLHTSPFAADLGDPIFHAIPMSYVDAIQRQTFWDDRTVEEVTKLLKVPRTGVPAYLSCSATTLSWKEYLLIREKEGKGHYHGVEGHSEPWTDHWRWCWRKSGQRESGSLASSRRSSSISGDRSQPVTPTDPALKKPEALTVADKWELAAERFVLEGGLSLAFQFQRSQGTLMLPERLQPWNVNSWKRGDLDELLKARVSKNRGATVNTSWQGHVQPPRVEARFPEAMEIDPVYNEDSDFLPPAAIAGDPVIEKWRCLEEYVWLQQGSDQTLHFLHSREAGNLDFSHHQHLNPNRVDSFGPGVMKQLHELRTRFIRERIDEQKKTTFTSPAVVRATGEDERQEILNFFRPTSGRVKTGGLPTPHPPVIKDRATPQRSEAHGSTVADGGSEAKSGRKETVTTNPQRSAESLGKQRAKPEADENGNSNDEAEAGNSQSNPGNSKPPDDEPCTSKNEDGKDQSEAIVATETGLELINEEACDGSQKAGDTKAKTHNEAIIATEAESELINEEEVCDGSQEAGGAKAEAQSEAIIATEAGSELIKEEGACDGSQEAGDSKTEAQNEAIIAIQAGPELTNEEESYHGNQEADDVKAETQNEIIITIEIGPALIREEEVYAGSQEVCDTKVETQNETIITTEAGSELIMEEEAYDGSQEAGDVKAEGDELDDLQGPESTRGLGAAGEGDDSPGSSGAQVVEDVGDTGDVVQDGDPLAAGDTRKPGVDRRSLHHELLEGRGHHEHPRHPHRPGKPLSRRG